MLTSVDPCNNLHPADLDTTLHSKTIFLDIAPYTFWNWNQMSSTVSSYLFAKWKARRITTFAQCVQTGWRIPQHRACQLAHRKMHSLRDNCSSHPATKWRNRTWSPNNRRGSTECNAEHEEYSPGVVGGDLKLCSLHFQLDFIQQYLDHSLRIMVRTET